MTFFRPIYKFFQACIRRIGYNVQVKKIVKLPPGHELVHTSATYAPWLLDSKSMRLTKQYVRILW